MKKIAIALSAFLTSTALFAAGQHEDPARRFLRAYGQPTDALVEKHQWKQVEAVNQREFEVTPLFSGNEQVEQSHYSLLVHRTTGVMYLARQGGIKGDWQFFGPISPSGT